MVPVAELLNEFTKPIEGINGMPKISIDSDTGTGFEAQLKIVEKISAEDDNNLNDQTIESIDNQLYVNSSLIFNQALLVSN